MRRGTMKCAMIAALVAMLPLNAAAQQRPLVTEDPETIGPGNVLIEGGFDYQWDVSYPASGLRGDLLRLPSLGASLGISSIAEIQIDGSLYNRLSITERTDAPLSDLVTATGDQTTGIDDITVGIKMRLLAEAARRPALGFRFATKLPTASNESGLGTDTTDILITALVGKTIQSIRLVGNVGVGILGDPTQGNRQNDVLLYGVSLARAIAEGVEIVGEFNGRANTAEEEPAPGTESRAIMRVGGRYTRGTARFDAGILLGMTSRDPSFGFTAGLTWVFKGFNIP